MGAKESETLQLSFCAKGFVHDRMVVSQKYNYRTDFTTVIIGGLTTTLLFTPLLLPVLYYWLVRPKK